MMNNEQSLTSDICAMTGANLEAVLFSDFGNQEGMIITSENIGDLAELEGTLCYDETTNELVYVNMIQSNLNANDLSNGVNSVFSALGNTTSPLADLSAFSDGSQIMMLNSSIVIPSEDDGLNTSRPDPLLLHFVQNPVEIDKKNDENEPLKIRKPERNVENENCNLVSADNHPLFDSAIELDDVAVQQSDPSISEMLQFSCVLCTKNFDNMKDYRAHVLSHKEKTYKCDYCGNSFNKHKNLILHEVIHNPSNLTCPLTTCQKTFRRLASLKAHIKIHEEEETLSCSECGEEFRNQMYLELHYKYQPQCRVSNDGSQVTDLKTCKTCNRKFSNFSTLAAHKKEHDKIKKALATKSHKKKLSPAKPSQRVNRCQVCSKWFHKPSQLERHERIHTGERPYQCTLCPKAFNQRNSLNIHMLKHTGDRPYLCPFCHAAFSQRGNLRQHINRVHSIPKVEDHVYECSECPCNFKKICSLNAHRNRVHLKKCNTPPTEISDPPRNIPVSNSGMNGESQDSDECDDDLESAPNSEKEFQSQNNYRQNEKQLKHDKMYICMNCPSTFHNATELRSHQCKAKNLPVDTTIHKEDTSIIEENDVQSDIENLLTDETTVNSIIVGIDKGNGELWDQTVYVHMKGDTRYYQCSHCTKQSTKLNEVIRHIKLNVVGKLFRCEYCAKTFNQHSVFLTHLKLHATAKTYECRKCNESFTNPAELSVHSKIHPEASCDYMCMLCCESYSLKDGEKHQCNLPDASTDSKVEIKTAISSNDRVQRLQDKANLILPPYNCSQCNITFPTYRKLKSHLQDHDGQLCKLCFSIFVTEESYLEHMKNSHKEKATNLICYFCDKQFRTKRRRDQHMKSHLKDTSNVIADYKCSKCDQAFQDPKSLSTHESNDHTILLTDGSMVSQETVEQNLRMDFGGNEAADTNMIELNGGVSEFIISNSANGDADVNTSESSNKNVSSISYTISVPDNLPLDPNLNNSVPELINSHTVNDKKESDTLTINASLLTKELLNGEDDLTLPSKDNFSYVIQNETLDECFPNNEVSVLTDDPNFNEQLSVYDETTDIVYKCTKCNLHCPTEIELQKHFQESQACCNGLPVTTYNYYYACNTCYLTFNTLPTFLRHLQTHNGNGTYACLYCNASNRTEAELTQHIAQHATKNEYPCIHCGELCSSSEAVKKHITETHLMSSADPGEAKRRKNVSSDLILSEREKLLLVDQTPNKFSSISQKVLSSLLKKNVRKDENVKDEKFDDLAENDQKLKKKATSSKDNMCSFCGRKFKKTCDLVRHVRTHTGEKPYKCDHCNKRFTVKSILNGHLKRHFTVNNICCHICNRFFSTVGSLKIHMRLHTGDRPYKCTYCEETFRTSGHRESHQKRHLAEKEKIEQSSLVSVMIEIGNNDELDLQLGDGINLQDEHFLIPEISDITNFKFQEDIDLANETTLSTSTECTVCNKPCINKTELSKHLNSHFSEREFVCTVCDAKFNRLSSLKAHTQTHVPSNKLCDVCQKTFASKKNLKAHKIRQHPETLKLPFQDDNGLILDVAIPLQNEIGKPVESISSNKWNVEDDMNLSALVGKTKKNELSDFFIMEKQFDLNLMSEFFPDDEKSELCE